MMAFVRKVNIDMLTYWLGFWFGMGIVILWIIAKLLGIIHSPLWVEMIPLFGFVFAICTVGIKIGSWKNSIEKGLKNNTKAIFLLREEMKVFREEIKAFREEYKSHLGKYHSRTW